MKSFWSFGRNLILALRLQVSKWDYLFSCVGRPQRSFQVCLKEDINERTGCAKGRTYDEPVWDRDLKIGCQRGTMQLQQSKLGRAVT